MDDNKQLWGKNTPWPTESSYFTYLRGCLRRAWNNNPIKIQVIRENRKQIANPNPKGKKPTVWGATCSICHNDFVLKDIQVDHINPAGKLQKIEDIQGFVERLLCIIKDDLRLVCKECNSLLAYSDKMGIPLEEAVIEKEAIKIIKERQDKQFFIDRGLDIPSNSIKRRQDIVTILKEENINK